ncbi:MAG: phage tail protein [Chloroflexi bacterium]|nr:phage tail protein [Chloroflexota bacterium]
MARAPTADPYYAAKFWVEIQGITQAYFTECSGLTAETEIQEYAEGGLNDFVHKLPGRTKFSNVVLKRGWVDSDDLWKWYSQVIAGKIQPQNVSIILYENTVNSPGPEKARWNLINAFPVKWQGPEFRADGTAVLVETLELAHQGFNRQ